MTTFSCSSNSGSESQTVHVLSVYNLCALYTKYIKWRHVYVRPHVSSPIILDGFG